jgi:hypothetical protein
MSSLEVRDDDLVIDSKKIRCDKHVLHAGLQRSSLPA